MAEKEKYLTYKGKIVFGKQDMPYFRRMPKTYFEDEACFVFVNSGEISVRAQTETLDLDPDHAVLAKCLNYFFESDSRNRTADEQIGLTAVILYPSLVQELFEFDLDQSNFSLDYNIKKMAVDRLLSHFRESINILLDNPELADESIIATKLKEFVLLISRSVDAPSELDFLSALFKPLDIEFKATIQNNLYSNMSVDELARLCHLSTSSFKRKFLEVYQTSRMKYISRKKTERAAALLRSGNSRISDIAWEAGFESLSTFHRNFNSLYGVAPSDYRVS